jgi:hypothetical protein
VVAYSAVLDELEAEALHIYRETAAAFRNPVLLYSIGKDSSSVLLHLAQKAFHPAPLPFQGDAHRHHLEVQGDDRVPSTGMRPKNSGSISSLRPICRRSRKAFTPFTHGTHEYTRIMKTVALREGLDSLRLRLRRSAVRVAMRSAVAGQGTHLLATRAGSPLGSSKAASGVLAHRQYHARRGADNASIPAVATGPSWISGATSSASR